MLLIGRPYFGVGRVLAGAFFSYVVLAGSSAHALPSYARQTGQGCPACHTNFPELTPFGREFKLRGYTMGGGDSPFPIAAMAQGAFTNTQKSQPGGAAPHFGPNDNFSLEAASLFYGGKIVDDIGAFVQATYSDTERTLAWDNVDIRYANSTTIGDRDLVYGITLNNNPTVEDIYNSTPAFGFPYVSASLAPTPAAATVLEGGLAQQVGGVGVYAMFDDTYYGLVSLYKTLPKHAQRHFGVDPTGEPEIDGVAPYWRFAVQQQWQDHLLSAGTFGLFADTFPGRERRAGTDSFVDTGLDAQYQFTRDPNVVTAQASWIHESQFLPASQALGLSEHRSNDLDSVKLAASYVYSHDDASYGFTASRFWLNGSTDAGLYGQEDVTGSANGSPDSRGWIFELDYMPFINRSPIKVWPWTQIKLSLQYTLYDKFNGASRNYDGAGRDASDNNTLMLSAWLAF
jgi:hypothetical protein